jgi:hypothetical protein
MHRLIILLIGLIALTACGKSIDTAEWTEEVKLSDGRMVIVWRRARAYSGGFPNAQRGGDIDFELRYEPLGVYWKDATTPTHVRRPKSFDVVDGVPHLVLEGNWDVCVDRPKADYAAQFLKWVNGRWVNVPQAEFPVERVLMNLYQDYWGRSTKDDARGLITWERKFGDGPYRRAPDTVKHYFERGSRICANRPPPPPAPPPANRKN